MEAPRRRVTLKVDIGGDGWEDVAQALESIALRIQMEGPITGLVSGGWSSGYAVTGCEDETQTGDKYRRENEAYVAALRDSRR